MSTKAEFEKAAEERAGPKKEKRPVKPRRGGREPGSRMRRVLESSRTRGQDIRVSHPRSRSGDW